MIRWRQWPGSVIAGGEKHGDGPGCHGGIGTGTPPRGLASWAGAATPPRGRELRGRGLNNTASGCPQLRGRGLFQHGLGESQFFGRGHREHRLGLRELRGRGQSNTASGPTASWAGAQTTPPRVSRSLPGWTLASTAGANSLVFGNSISLNFAADGSVYLADGVLRTNPDSQTAANHFFGRFGGGYTFFTNSSDTDDTTGVTLAADGTAWARLSSRSTKEGFEPVDKVEILEKVAGLSWFAGTTRRMSKTPTHGRDG